MSQYSRDIDGKGEAPIFIEFELRAVPDQSITIEEGKAGYRDEIYVIAHPPGDVNNTVERIAQEWVDYKRDSGDKFADFYQKALDAFKEGLEPPECGTSLERWPGITPAELKNCRGVHLRTVEALAGANDAALRRMGMGAMALQQRARAWLETIETGKGSEKVAALEVDIALLRQQLEEKDKLLQEAFSEIEALTKTMKGAGNGNTASDSSERIGRGGNTEAVTDSSGKQHARKAATGAGKP